MSPKSGVFPVSVPPVEAIVLAGTYDWGGSTLDELRPRPLLPVVQTPLIVHVLQWLRSNGIEKASICANSASRAVRSCLGDGASLGMSLRHHEDWTPRGAAGCARDAGQWHEASTLVIADGAMMPTADLPDLLRRHWTAGAALTVAVHLDADGPTPTVNPAGIYVCDRRALEGVPATGFQDIKEGLIPRLHRAGQRVLTHGVAGPCFQILGLETYLSVNEWMVERMVAEQPWPEDYASWDQTLAHLSARVHASARLIGPVILGPNVTIQKEATIVGPTAIGAGSRVDAGAVISRTVTWDHSVVGSEALVDRCLLGDDVEVEARAVLFGQLKSRARLRTFGRRRFSADLPEVAWGLVPAFARNLGCLGGVSVPTNRRPSSSPASRQSGLDRGIPAVRPQYRD